jgi:hypothetical protein
MRPTFLRTLPLFVGAALLSGCLVPTHSTTEVGVVAQAPGPGIVVFAYSSSLYGDWRSHYLGWTPVTIYYYGGHYYSRPVPRARRVVVYRRGADYFFPPRDRAWGGFDRRYDYRHAPTWRDHGRAQQKDKGRRGRP